MENVVKIYSYIGIVLGILSFIGYLMVGDPVVLFGALFYISWGAINLVFIKELNK